MACLRVPKCSVWYYRYGVFSSPVAEACFSMLAARRISIQDRADRWSRSISPIWPSSPRVRPLVGHGEGKGDEKGLLQRTNGRTQRSSGRFVGKLFSLGMPECYPTRAVRPVRDFFFSFLCGTAAPQGNIAVCSWPSITTSLASSPRH